jgi:hypothetical protein
VGESIFGESLLHCRALHRPFGEWWIQSNGADALSPDALTQMHSHGRQLHFCGLFRFGGKGTSFVNLALLLVDLI